MGEYKRPSTESEFDSNFEQIKPLMDNTEALNESSRCLFCYDAPCVQACPTGIDIPLFIRQINTTNTIGAAKTIYASNFFGNACGKVCPTEVLCEGSCVFNEQDQKPIEIGRLQSFATQKAIREDAAVFPMAKNQKGKVAVIGAGPAGLSCAGELRQNGVEVDVFEARDLPSGLTLYGVAPYKITNEETLQEMEFLQKQLGFDVQYGKKINSKKEFKKLEENYDAIFIGFGLGDTRSIGLKGEELENCIGATEFIEKLRIQKENTLSGEVVVVLGGGNTAMDAASEAARMGAQQSLLVYRRDKEGMGAYDFEYELAKHAGVSGLFNTNPVEILGNGKVDGIRLVPTEEKDGKLVNIEDSSFELNCDMVILATGQKKKTGILENIEKLDFDSKGRIVVDSETHQCTNPMYFAGGDAVNGGAEIVNAVSEGKKAGLGILSYLKSKIK